MAHRCSINMPPIWLSDNNVRKGVPAMLDLQRADEEDLELAKEQRAMQMWFAEGWRLVNVAMERADTEGLHYSLHLRREHLLCLCATWRQSIADDPTAPPWGPDAADLAEAVATKERAAAKDIDCHDHVLMVIYLQHASAFEDDFGHSFSGHDGLDEHFKQMMHYTWYASWLRMSHKNNLAAMALEVAHPLHFGVWNPYPEGHKRQVDFDAKLRTYTSALLEAPDFVALLKTVVDTFQFKARNVYQLHSDVEMVLRGYYQSMCLNSCDIHKYMEDELQTVTLHHWEVWADQLSEEVGDVLLFHLRWSCMGSVGSVAQWLSVSDIVISLKVYLHQLAFPVLGFWSGNTSSILQ
ncbi:hypothetical protein B0H19DRAFT_1074601 [Mycena capillaripes]|nr:hypothetical protein B0H19DRAFT_1074601 [Mycena capillaripes]